jgi:hypothetical protein
VNLTTEPRDSQGHRLEDWQALKGDKGASFDPSVPVECEVADYILIHGLGRAGFEALKLEASKPKKRKRQTEPEGEEDLIDTSPTAKRARKTKDQDTSSQPKPARKPSRKKRDFNEVPGDTPPPEEPRSPPRGHGPVKARGATSTRPRKKKQPFNEIPGDTPPPEERPSYSRELSGLDRRIPQDQGRRSSLSTRSLVTHHHQKTALIDTTAAHSS